MVELRTSEFSILTKLLNKEKIHCTFAYAVIEKSQQGRIFVDNQSNPTCYLIACKSGKYLVGGRIDIDDFNKSLSDFLISRENHNIYYDIYSTSNLWVNKLDELLCNTVVKLSRKFYEWDYQNFASISKLSENTPNGFELKKMDAMLFEKYATEVDTSYYKLWGNANNFLSNGFGFCILKGSEFISVCNTYYVRKGYAEIDIVTNNDFRKQGFALITCAEFIKHCLKKNINPIWDCDDGNGNSKKLAIKLGFKLKESYQMHWWHEDTKLVNSYLEKFHYNSK